MFRGQNYLFSQEIEIKDNFIILYGARADYASMNFCKVCCLRCRRVCLGRVRTWRVWSKMRVHENQS